MNPFKTLGRWLWRWWNGFERRSDLLAFECKKFPLYSASVEAADMKEKKDALVRALEEMRYGNVFVIPSEQSKIQVVECALNPSPDATGTIELKLGESVVKREEFKDGERRPEMRKWDTCGFPLLEKEQESIERPYFKFPKQLLDQ